MRIVISDDDPFITASLTTILNAQPDIEVVAVASSGPEAERAFYQEKPDILLLDIRMPNGDGLTAAERVLARFPAARVVFLTTFADDDYLVRALRMGACGYLIKQDVATIAPALRSVMAGQNVLGGDVMERMFLISESHAATASATATVTPAPASAALATATRAASAPATTAPASAAPSASAPTPATRAASAPAFAPASATPSASNTPERASATATATQAPASASASGATSTAAAASGPGPSPAPAAASVSRETFYDARLTERECRIVELIAQGCDNKHIASTIYISEGTVRNHISSILMKLGLRNRTQIAVHYWRGRMQ